MYRVLLGFLLSSFVHICLSKFIDTGVPQIRILHSRHADSVPEMTVRFPDGHKDVVELKRSSIVPGADSSCAYRGFLVSERTPVALTGCLNERKYDRGSNSSMEQKYRNHHEVTMYSKHSPQYERFTVDSRGVVRALENPFNGSSFKYISDRDIPSEIMVKKPEDLNFVLEGDEVFNAGVELKFEQFAAYCEHEQCQPPPARVQAIIQLGYEATFFNRLERDTVNILRWFNDLMTHVQCRYEHPSLGTKIELVVVGDTPFVQDVWTATAYHLERTAYHSNPFSAIDIYSWFCDDYYSGDKVLGIAMIGGCCHEEFRTNLNEWRESVSEMAYIFAHELGHNFGMRHDFDHIMKCNGIMHYGQPPQVWSPCSRWDFRTMYMARNWGQACLDTLPDEPSGTNCTEGEDDGVNDNGDDDDEDVSGDDSEEIPPTTPTTPVDKCIDEVGYIGDEYCDDNFNIPECDYDKGDCCFSRRTDWNAYCTECKCIQPGYHTKQ